MKNNVQLFIDNMIASLPKEAEPKSIKTSYAFKKKLGAEYAGIKVKYSINVPQNSIQIIT